MTVTLISHTPEPEKTIACAAKLCYSPSGIEELMDGLTEEKVESFIQKLTALGHQSPLEHCTFTFGIEGVSRALSHQLVRHRIASYSQKSQRYVNEEGFEYVTPESIARDEICHIEFDDLMGACNEMYKNLIQKGVPAEDARFVLPNACETKIIVTMNIRSLLHFFEERCCERAQWEIRAMAKEMLQICKSVAPNLFAKAGPSCVRGKCKEGPMSCGRPVKEGDSNG
jgi:thymidylate synthase (FAD)